MSMSTLLGGPGPIGLLLTIDPLLMGGKQTQPPPSILEPTSRAMQHENKQRDPGKVNMKPGHTLQHTAFDPRP